ncbi:MAG: hypothetical protein AAGB48_05560 [Planctomycetota bacterium]
MAKGQNLSAHQQKIVQRYYENADTITITKLQELVTEIYLISSSGGGKKADTLWKRAHDHLKKTNIKPDVVQAVVSDRDVKRLAELVTNASVPNR